MKYPSPYIRTLALVSAILLTTHVVPAAVFEWTSAGGVDFNWSSAANWNPAGPPGTADTALFGVTATTNDLSAINNVVNSTRTVTALSYTNSVSGEWHVTE